MTGFQFFIILIATFLTSLSSQALLENDFNVGSDIEVITSRCESQPNDSLKLACYQNQLRIAGQEGSVQSAEAYQAASQKLTPSVNCYRDFCIGEEVFYNPGSDTFRSEVAEIDESNRFTLKVYNDDGSIKELKKGLKFDQLIKASGCHFSLCIGQDVYQVRVKNGDIEKYIVKIVGIAFNGTFTVDYIGGEFSSKYGSKWDLDDFALFDGCFQHVCVGQEYLRVSDNSRWRAKVIAMTYDDKFIIEYIEGKYADGKHYGNWGADSLVPLK